MNQLRQGDVYLTRIPNPDTDNLTLVKPERPGLIVLAHGEATGHIHALAANRAKLYRDVVGMMLVVDRAVNLRHGNPAHAWKGDHGDVKILPGAYRVTIDREYEPNGWREVAD